MSARITLVQGDITRQRADALVNAANSSLLGGGGVDGAIHRRGGPEILADCRRLRASRYGKGLPTGRAVATTAGRLDAAHVIHTVGPVWSPTEDRSALLASCYRESLRVAAELGARTVAFPAISTGVYRWPLDDAARIAVGAVRGALAAGVEGAGAGSGEASPGGAGPVGWRFDEVRFVLFDEVAYRAFVEALAPEG
ncbi:O-acetyl-ADP-ribose deacetylase [Streptomyces alboflavus]|uniref:O-acetyl-ADP-ribose deacetylase n=1 Tax=Streptomyces alboflavus TaxID=67267 RepID=UPI00369B7BF5